VYIDFLKQFSKEAVLFPMYDSCALVNIHLAMNSLCDFLALCSVPFVCVSVFLPKEQCSSLCSFVVHIEGR
jgi:hypothetical protein